jgi:hypothetical protein
MAAALSRKRRVVSPRLTLTGNYGTLTTHFRLKARREGVLVRPRRSYTCNFQDGRDINMKNSYGGRPKKRFLFPF